MRDGSVVASIACYVERHYFVYGGHFCIKRVKFNVFCGMRLHTSLDSRTNKNNKKHQILITMEDVKSFAKLASLIKIRL